MKKSGFTLDEHREVGARLGSIRNELTGLSVKVGNAYSHKIGDDLAKAVYRIDRVRSDLEDKMLSENPEISNDDGLNIYYGKHTGKKQN